MKSQHGWQGRRGYFKFRFVGLLESEILRSECALNRSIKVAMTINN